MKHKFTEQEIKDRIKSSPELFSPNVITRCLFQQRILPNVCYLGGPAEIVYWESIKKFFENCSFPNVKRKSVSLNKLIDASVIWLWTQLVVLPPSFLKT